MSHTINRCNHSYSLGSSKCLLGRMRIFQIVSAVCCLFELGFCLAVPHSVSASFWHLLKATRRNCHTRNALIRTLISWRAGLITCHILLPTKHSNTEPLGLLCRASTGLLFFWCQRCVQHFCLGVPQKDFSICASSKSILQRNWTLLKIKMECLGTLPTSIHYTIPKPLRPLWC